MCHSRCNLNTKLHNTMKNRVVPPCATFFSKTNVMLCHQKRCGSCALRISSQCEKISLPYYHRDEPDLNTLQQKQKYFLFARQNDCVKISTQTVFTGQFMASVSYLGVITPLTCKKTDGPARKKVLFTA